MHRNDPRLIVTCLITAAVALGVVSLGGADIEEGSATSLKPRVVDAKHPPKIRAQPLGRTVELTFRLKSQDPQTITVTTATTRYSAEINFSGSAAAADMRFIGDLQVLPRDSKSGRSKEKLLITSLVGITYDANESINASFDVSSELEYGEETYLVRYGELSVTVEAELID